MSVMPWVLLAAGVAPGADDDPGVVHGAPLGVAVPAFILSWLGSGMAGWWMVLVSLVTGALVALGGLSAWPGWVGLGLIVASMAALVARPSSPAGAWPSSIASSPNAWRIAYGTGVAHSRWCFPGRCAISMSSA